MKARDRTRQYLGLELGGSKSSRTTLATLEYYPKEEKLFLLDVVLGIGPESGKGADSALIELLAESGDNIQAVGVNAPLTLPRCFNCAVKKCIRAGDCSDPGVKWARSRCSDRTQFTPYTQRPVEIWLRRDVVPRLLPQSAFEVEDAMGANRAPLAARFQHLHRFSPIPNRDWFEVWPKLTAAVLGTLFHVPGATLNSLRQLESGEAARTKFLDIMIDRCDIFVYDRDQRKLAQHLGAFDAFLSSYSAFLAKTGHTEGLPKSFDRSWGWVYFPRA